MPWLGSITNSMDMNLSKFWEIVDDRGPWCATVHEVTESQAQLSNWTTTYGFFIESLYWSSVIDATIFLFSWHLIYIDTIDKKKNYGNGFCEF